MTKTLRHVGLLFMAIMAMATFFACSNDGDDIEKVALDVTAGETGGNSITFNIETCLLYTSPSPRDRQKSRMPSSA